MLYSRPYQRRLHYKEIDELAGRALTAGRFRTRYADLFEGDARWKAISVSSMSVGSSSTIRTRGSERVCRDRSAGISNLDPSSGEATQLEKGQNNEGWGSLRLAPSDDARRRPQHHHRPPGAVGDATLIG